VKVLIDPAKCKGHGQCAAVAPRVFELGDDDKSHVRLPPGSDIAPVDAPLVDDAIAMCPEAAISWAGPGPGSP
jgi:ferredoxin